MQSILHSLPRSVLEELSRALSSGRVSPPYYGMGLREWLDASQDQIAVAAELERLRGAGISPAGMAMVMDLLAIERAREQDHDDRVEMVWTGPDQPGPAARDTGVVAREMLSQATRSLLITTFSLSRDSATFEPVHEAMARHAGLDVTIVLNADARDGLSGVGAVQAFARGFWSTQWPWPRRPKVFYDPRSVEEQKTNRAIQHSKCIVADLERVFITSANYTESGQLRNVELGVLVQNDRLAVRVDTQFRTLIARGLLRPLPADSAGTRSC